MIKFTDTAFVQGVLYRAGMLAIFDAPTEAQLIAVGDAVNFKVITQPVEVLSCSAVPVSCVSTAVDEVLASFTIPAGVLGVNSILQFEPLWTYFNSANNKILRIKIGGTTIYDVTRTTSGREAPLIVMANRNSLASQVYPLVGNYFTGAAGAPVTTTIDLSGNVTVQITGQRAAAEALTLDYYRVVHFTGA